MDLFYFYKSYGCWILFEKKYNKGNWFYYKLIVVLNGLLILFDKFIIFGKLIFLYINYKGFCKVLVKKY